MKMGELIVKNSLRAAGPDSFHTYLETIDR